MKSDQNKLGNVRKILEGLSVDPVDRLNCFKVLTAVILEHMYAY